MNPVQERILLSQAHVTALEEEFVLDALRSGWVAPLGPHVDAFEAEIAQRLGVAGALALSSGTAALHLALEGLGAAPGTAVVLPSMTFAASANAVAYTGATPVFVDCGDDANLDPRLMLEAVDTLQAEGTTVAACMSVDLFGRMCEYDDLTAELTLRGVPLVEDAAEALGAVGRQGPAGSFGRAAALSFNGNKVMTTSGGGMLLSDDTDLLGRARYLSTQARRPVPWYEHTEIGYNYRLSNLLAALGRAQLQRLEEMIARRRDIRSFYAAQLAEVPGVRLLSAPEPQGGGGDNCWLTCLLFEQGDIDVDQFVAALDAAGVEARHLWKPMHLQPLYSGARSFLSGRSERLFRTGITVPSGSALRDDQVERVAYTLVTTLAAMRS